MKEVIIEHNNYEEGFLPQPKELVKNKYNLIIRFIFFIFIIIIFRQSYQINEDIGPFNKTNKINLDYVRRNYGSFIDSLPYYNHTYITNKTIFWCWFQGFDTIPKLALAGLNSIKQNLKDYNIIILNETNINEYVDIPRYIMYKYKKSMFTRTHFSDILRLELLNKYGGTWIDASVLITKYDPRFYNNILFFFGERKSEGCVGSSWFITSEKGSPILRTTLDLLYEYWKRNHKLRFYFLLHLFIKMACDKYKADYKKVKYISNKAPHSLQWKLKKKFNKKTYENIIKKASVHKLTIHINDTQFKKNTYYSHIIDEYYPK